MEKISLAEPEQYLKETEKALEIVQRKIKEQINEMSPQDKLRALDKLLAKTKDFQEHKELSKEKALVEFKNKNGESEYFIPEDVRVKIAENREIELQELYTALKEKQSKLDQSLKEVEQLLEKDVLPLLSEINGLYQREYLAKSLDAYLGATYGYGADENIITRYGPGAYQSREEIKNAEITKSTNAFLAKVKGVNSK